MQAVFLNDEESVNKIVSAMSKPRLTKYLQASSGNVLHALRLYHWNAQLSQALYLPLQSWEIVLRNRLNNFFIYKYDPKWPWNDRAIRNFNGNDRKRLQETVARLNRDLAPAVPTTDQIVADLSAGFWVSQFGADYAAQYGWRANLKHRIFTNNPEITREDADEICSALLELRNRVAHHEPILHLPLDDWREDLEWILNGMCGISASYMSSACSFNAIWAAKPGS